MPGTNDKKLRGSEIEFNSHPKSKPLPNLFSRNSISSDLTDKVEIGSNEGRISLCAEIEWFSKMGFISPRKAGGECICVKSNKEL